MEMGAEAVAEDFGYIQWAPGWLPGRVVPVTPLQSEQFFEFALKMSVSCPRGHHVQHARQ